MRPVIILFILIFTTNCFSQNLTQDTVFIHFKVDSLTNPQFTINNIIDNRKDKELSVFDKKKYLLLPVDVFVFPDHPLDSELLKLKANETGKKSYDLNIQNFYLSNRKGNFFPGLILEAKVGVYEQNEDTVKFVGQLFYQSEYKKKSLFEKYPESCENSIKMWQSDFVRDMNTIGIAGDKSYFILSNLFLEEKMKDLFMNINISGVLGINWWLVDAELFFTSPEISKRTVYIANILRYQNHPDFESFAYGWKSEHLQYRLTKVWTFDGSADILIGVNKWKNMEETDPGLEQILNLNFSLTQTLAYKPANNHMYGKFGIMENMIYIYKYGFKINPGLYLTIGSKF